MRKFPALPGLYCIPTPRHALYFLEVPPIPTAVCCFWAVVSGHHHPCGLKSRSGLLSTHVRRAISFCRTQYAVVVSDYFSVRSFFPFDVPPITRFPFVLLTRWLFFTPPPRSVGAFPPAIDTRRPRVLVPSYLPDVRPPYWSPKGSFSSIPASPAEPASPRE